MSVYTTVDMGRKMHVDVNPTISKNLKDYAVNLNLGRTYGDFTFAVSSDVHNGKMRELKDTDMCAAWINKGNFADLRINFGKKKVRIAFQKALR